jgi:hypothetical protein
MNWEFELRGIAAAVDLDDLDHPLGERPSFSAMISASEVAATGCGEKVVVA